MDSLYPWARLPLVVSAPMLGAATPRLAVNVSRAGGIGFIAGGSDHQSLAKQLEEIKALLKTENHAAFSTCKDVLPIGVGFQLFACDMKPLVDVLARYRPAIVWLFAAKADEDLAAWASHVRSATGGASRIWLQVASIDEMTRGVKHAQPDVLVLQGADAGGHGQVQAASIISLIPEAIDTLSADGLSIPVLAAGGIVDARGFTAALALGAHGAVFGTRFLVAEESGIAQGWKSEILRVSDGGITTVRSTLCDRLKQTKGWPEWYDGRAIRNQGHTDEATGMSDDDNVNLYKAESQSGDSAWGLHGRMVAYAGTGVGLIKKIESAETIVNEIRLGAHSLMASLSQKWSQ